MADTLFTNGTVVQAAWLNDANTAVYDKLSAVTGTNTILATGPLSLTAYANGQNFYLVPAVTNTGPVTINISGLGAASVTKAGATPLIAGDLIAGAVYELSYDGVRFQVLNPGSVPIPGAIPAANITGQVAIVNGGTGSATAQAAKEALLVPQVGQCYMTTSGANIILQQENGIYLTINRQQEVIPAAGVQLAPTGTAANTLYYIYAFMSAGVMTLEYSTTVPVADTVSGVQIKTGDVTRTLVGQSTTGAAAGAWANTTVARNTLSWFNRKRLIAILPLTATITATSVSLVEMSAAYRIAVGAWNGQEIRVGHTGAMTNTTGGFTINLVLASITGSVSLTVGNLEAGTAATPSTASYQHSAVIGASFPAVANGRAIIGLLGASGSGTLSVIGGGSAGTRSVLFAVTEG